MNRQATNQSLARSTHAAPGGKQRMKSGSIRQLWLIVALDLAASAVLQLSDHGRRVRSTPAARGQYPAIAIMQIASTTLLDTHVDAVVRRLDEKGYRAQR
jgi:hypothetical protein